MSPLLISGKDQRRSSEGRVRRRRQPVAAVPMVAVRDCLGNKSSSVCLSLPSSPANCEWMCGWETGSQEPKQHLLSPWKSALSALVPRISPCEEQLKSPQTLGVWSVPQGQSNRVYCYRLDWCPPHLIPTRAFTRRQRVLQWKMETLTMMTRRMFWKSSLCPRA